MNEDRDFFGASTRARGRPSIYSAELAEEVSFRLMEGRSLRSISQDDDMPSLRTLVRWIATEGHEFQKVHAHAREVQAEMLADEMMDVANDGTNDWMEIKNRDGECIGWKVNGEAVQRSKLRLEQMRWNAERLKPRKYGARVDLTSSDGSMSPASDLSAADRAVRVAQLLAAAQARAPQESEDEGDRDAGSSAPDA